MFLLNSCLSLFSAAHVLGGHPFSRSYGVILPSSLTMLLPSALGFSPHPPVSVYGTGTVCTIAAFLGSRNRVLHYSLIRYASLLCFMRRICLPHSSCACTGFSFPGSPYPSASPHFKILQCRNLHLLSIGYALRPRLRSRLTQGRSALPWKPWIFGR